MRESDLRWLPLKWLLMGVQEGERKYLLHTLCKKDSLIIVALFLCRRGRLLGCGTVADLVVV